MKNAVYWIALQSALGYASPNTLKIMEQFSSINEFFEVGESGWRELKLFTPAILLKLKTINFDKVKQVIEVCAKQGYNIVTPDDEQYPSSLLSIYCPPAVLYVKGELPSINDAITIGMVGTRKCTQNGYITALVLSYRLSQAGAVIISGGAVGIDAACSVGSLAAKAKSVILLGCGLNYPYLPQNKGLRDNVAKNGAIISEYQPDYPPSIYTFPERNRIISAMSLGVAVIEAPTKSGALITARYALEQGKDVFAVPGDIISPYYAGNNKLLQDGAKAIYTPGDILLEYNSTYPHMLNLKNAMIPLPEDKLFIKLYNKYNAGNQINDISQINQSVTQQVAPQHIMPQRKDEKSITEQSDEQKPHDGPFVLKPLNFEADESVLKVYNCFTAIPATIDMLAERCGLEPRKVLSAMTELEINGAVRLLNGGFYEANIL